MSFEFGVFHEFPRYAGVMDAEAFTQSFAQVDAAERWGLDVIWIAELHFFPERSVASAPLLIASAIASQTRRIKIGIAVQVLPLCNPLRLMGKDPLAREDLHAAMRTRQRNTRLRVIGACDTALWDIAAKTAGMPLYKFLSHAENRRQMGG
jgi:hypothetical protein